MNKINLTPIIFGENAINELPKNITKYKRALLVTGKSSIKKNNVYNDLLKNMEKTNVELIEFWGMKPNPTSDQINSAAQLGIEKNVDLIIAAGGGSAVDAAKVVATMIANPKITESWEIVQGKEYKNKPIDIISIITLAGTASENNSNSVITNEKLQLKAGIKTRRPILAIEDATYTQSLPKWQTSAGIFDTFSHITEQYFFQEKPFDWTDNYNFGLIKTLIKSARLIIEDPTNINARENILFTSSMALNGLSSFNNNGGDWGVHKISHGFAGYYDTTHGATLALITPSYWIYMSNKYPEFENRLIKLGKEIWNKTTRDETVEELKRFIDMLQLPTRYSDFEYVNSISDDDIKKCAKAAKKTNHLKEEDIVSIMKMIKE